MLLTSGGRAGLLSGFQRTPKPQAPPRSCLAHRKGLHKHHLLHPHYRYHLPITFWGRGGSREGRAGSSSEPREKRASGGGGKITHADASSSAGVRSAVAEEAAALLARLHFRAAVAPLAGAHQTARAVVQHCSHPGGASRRRLGARGWARVGAALSRSGLGTGDTRRDLSVGTCEGGAIRGPRRGN